MKRVFANKFILEMADLQSMSHTAIFEKSDLWTFPSEPHEAPQGFIRSPDLTLRTSNLQNGPLKFGKDLMQLFIFPVDCRDML